MQSKSEDAGDVFARTLNADSTLTATQTLGPGLIEQTGGTTVGLVAGGQGRSVVVWTSTASGKQTVELRRRTSTTLAAPERLRSTAQRVFRPLVATNAGGQVAAAWTEDVPATDTPDGLRPGAGPDERSLTRPGPPGAADTGRIYQAVFVLDPDGYRSS